MSYYTNKWTKYDCEGDQSVKKLIRIGTHSSLVYIYGCYFANNERLYRLKHGRYYINEYNI